jgi:beta-glucanase (GH16 family)
MRNFQYIFLLLSTVVHACVDYTYNSFTHSDLKDFIIESGRATIENDVLVMNMDKSSIDNYGVAVTLGHKSFFQWGTIQADVSIEMVPGAVYSLILMSEKTGSTDIRDEIDWEWVQLNDEVQTNFFLTDKPVYSTNGRRHKVNNIGMYHNYKLEWNNGNVKWYIDQQLIRTANGTLPSLSSQVKMGIWDSGRTGNTGTINWAGGPINWNDKRTIKMRISSLSIKCSSTSTTSIQSSTNREIQRDTNVPVLKKCWDFK